MGGFIHVCMYLGRQRTSSWILVNLFFGGGDINDTYSSIIYNLFNRCLSLCLSLRVLDERFESFPFFPPTPQLPNIEHEMKLNFSPVAFFFLFFFFVDLNSKFIELQVAY